MLLQGMRRGSFALFQHFRAAAGFEGEGDFGTVHAIGGGPFLRETKK
jgi:hypothetical protein